MNARYCFFALFLFGSTAWAEGESFRCVLKARDNFMHPFESVSGAYNGDRPMVIEVKGIALRFQHTGAGESRRLAMQLKSSKQNSAVTVGPLPQQYFYLNLLDGDWFAVAECQRLNGLAAKAGEARRTENP